MKEQIEYFKSKLEKYGAKLVVVSKTHPAERVKEVYELGERDFGENKVQEMLDKQGQLPKDIRWHLIGHLQTNKVKYIAPFVHLIHSVDSLKLLQEVNKQALKCNRIIDCLLQVHVAEEETKFGLDKAELAEIMDSEDLQNMEGIRIKGIMGMASFVDNPAQIRREFLQCKNYFDLYKELKTPQVDFEYLSIGMSGDFEIALECGATHVRIGSAIFGARNYAKP